MNHSAPALAAPALAAPALAAPALAAPALAAPALAAPALAAPAPATPAPAAPAPAASADIPRVAMILAAGRGERMRPLTDSIPKPLLKIRGTPLIVRTLERLAGAGFERVVINLSWLGSKISDCLGDGSRYGLSIVYSDESAQALETAGGIFRALEHLEPGPFAVVNGDIYCDYEFGQLRLAAQHDAHLVLVPNPPHHPQGDFGLERGLAVPTAAEAYTFSGIAAYRPRFFANCTPGVFPLKPLLVRAMTAGRCSAELYAGPWADVGTPARLEALNACA